MIRLYFSNLNKGTAMREQIVSELSYIHNVETKEYYQDEGFQYGSNNDITIACITPSTYDSNYISNILREVADNPKNLIVFMQPTEYTSDGYLISYPNNQKGNLKLIKKAFVLEEEKLFESLYGLKKYISKKKKIN